jgi:hypothetical protein
VVPQDKDAPLIGRERLDRPIEPGLELGPFEPRRGIVGRGRPRRPPVPERSLLDRPLPSPGLEIVEPGVEGDPAKPRIEGPGGVEPVQGEISLDEGLLGKVVGRLVGAGQAPSEGVDPLLVGPDQALEGVHVSLLGSSDEDGVLRTLVRSRRSSHG